MVAPVGANIAVDSTILSSSTPAATGDCRGTIDTGAANLVQTPAGCTRPGGDTLTGDPAFGGALANNGGPTQTLAITLASPVLNAGANPASLASDQRGLPRVSGPGTDIGAFELQLPVAANDSVTVAQDSGATTIDVLANDTPNEVPSPQVLSTTTPAHGTATFTPGGVTYTPASGFCGSDSFDYTITGGSTATVAVTVTCTVVPPPPPPPPPTPVPPQITALSVTRTPFAVAHPRIVRGTKIVITLTKDATVNFVIQRKPRKAGQDASRNRIAKSLKAGTSRLSFSGIVKGKVFNVGRYTLGAVATDSDGLRSNRRQVSFRIAPPSP